MGTLQGAGCSQSQLPCLCCGGLQRSLAPLSPLTPPAQASKCCRAERAGPLPITAVTTPLRLGAKVSAALHPLPIWVQGADFFQPKERPTQLSARELALMDEAAERLSAAF